MKTPLLGSSIALAIALSATEATFAETAPGLPSIDRSAVPAAPSVELEPDRTACCGLANPFDPTGTKAGRAGSTLVAPATEAADTDADALSITTTGRGRAMSASIDRPGNNVSAIKGQTNGSGAGVNGINTGTTGPAGKFQLPNAASLQPALSSTTTGRGHAIVGIVAGSSGLPQTSAVLGSHDQSPGYGIGVEGRGGSTGVEGNGRYYGVRGRSDSSFGVFGESLSGFGVVGASNTGYAGVFYGRVMASGNVTAMSFSLSSDRTLKQGIEPVNPADLLDRIAALSISSWDFKAAPGVHHIGPMAQDFRAAFGLGADDTHIDVVDIAGVNLAAIQALQKQLREKDARIAALEARDAEMDALKTRVAQLAGLAQAVQALQAQMVSTAAQARGVGVGADAGGLRPDGAGRADATRVSRQATRVNVLAAGASPE